MDLLIGRLVGTVTRYESTVADPNGEPIYSGNWKATGFGISATVLTDDGQEATVEMVTTAKGLAIRKVIDPDGEEQAFAEARLKRVKAALKKDQ